MKSDLNSFDDNLIIEAKNSHMVKLTKSNIVADLALNTQQTAVSYIGNAQSITFCTELACHLYPGSTRNPYSNPLFFEPFGTIW